MFVKPILVQHYFHLYRLVDYVPLMKAASVFTYQIVYIFSVLWMDLLKLMYREGYIEVQVIIHDVSDHALAGPGRFLDYQK